MTIKEYLQNPYGKGSAFSASTKQKENLDLQFKSLMPKMKAKVYRYRDNVIYHIIVPSTNKETVSYDVIIEVETKYLPEGAANLEELQFKCFSNCPSFIFTFANVFRTNNLMCEWLVSKYNKEVKLNPPIKRNFYGIVGLERSLYLAVKYIHTTGQTKFGVYQTTGKKLISRQEIINSVRTQQQIMDNYKDKLHGDSKSTVVGKKVVEDKNQKNGMFTNPKAATSRATKTVKSIRTSSSSKSTKKTGTVKKTKRI